MSAGAASGPRILLFANNWVGWRVTQWLAEEREHIAGLVLHPSDRQKYGREIEQSAGVESSRVFDGSRLREPEVLAAVRDLRADIGVSALFGYLIRRELFDSLPMGCVNLHPAYLPYNRGAHPNVWSIVEGTPAGVTLHYLDDGADTGDIIAQRLVEQEPVDTGERLYHKLERAAVRLFADTWPSIRCGEAARFPQPRDIGTTHRVRDLSRLDELDLDRTYTARELLNLIRARTFPPYDGAYFRHGDRTVHVRIDLRYAGQSEAEHDAEAAAKEER